MTWSPSVSLPKESVIVRVIIGVIATILLANFMWISWKIHTFDTFVDAFGKKTRILTHLTEVRSLRNVLVINELFVISDESVK